MDLHEIEVEIDIHGQVSLHVKGISGKACLVVTKDLEQVLGNMVIDRQMTPEALAAEINPPLESSSDSRLTH